jgi:redox-sensing transcriptional repressor
MGTKNTMKPKIKSIARFFRYREALYRLKSFNISITHSDQLASLVGLTAVRVRKDFSFYKVSGKRNRGYKVSTLLKVLSKILNKNDQNKAIFVGFGEFGKVAFHEYFIKDPVVDIIAIFDENTLENHAVEPQTGIPILPMASLMGFIHERGVRYGVMGVTDNAAQRILDHMAVAGIQGVISLAAADLKSPKSCTVMHFNPVREMENLICIVESRQQDRKGAL